MTLVLALRCREGAVLAADDQLTYRAPRGYVTRTTAVTKLHHARGIAWGWAGRQDAAQRFGVELYEERAVSSEDRRSTVHDAIEAALRAGMAKIEDDPSLDVLVVWWSRPLGKALILRANGLAGSVRSAFVDDAHNVEMIGSPQTVRLAEFALRMLGFGDFRDVGMEEAKVVAHKVIADVAAFTDDVGRPRYILDITEGGIGELDAQDVAAIASSADVWTANLRATLVRETAPAPSTTEDTGLRPPG